MSPTRLRFCRDTWPGATRSWDDLRPQLRARRPLALAALLGGLGGALLLITIPAAAFRDAVPYLLLASCGLLLAQDHLREWLRPSGAARTGPQAGVWAGPGGGADPAGPGPVSPPPGTIDYGPVLLVTVFVAAVYGGFFGAGLGIVLLAVLGLFSSEPLSRVNALKTGTVVRH